MEKRILIIKLGSKGDVLRTTPLLHGLKEKYPISQISWLTYEDSLEVLDGNIYIDRLFSLKLESILGLLVEEFDFLINLDKDYPALALANLIKAKEKKGFGLGRDGEIIPLNPGSQYSVKLGLDDELKFYKNKKTYQELIFECAEIKFSLNYEYILELPARAIKFAEEFFKNKKIKEDDIVIGISTGAGKRFANKMLSIQEIVELIDRLHKNLDIKIILLGGPLELEINKRIKELVNFEIIDSGYNPIKNFAGLVKRCNLVISGDTLTMHIAIALKRPILAIFGPTCHQEIELYGRGEKIISEIPCSPCYKHTCNKKPNCMDAIEVKKIYNTVVKFLSNNRILVD
ncbi:MAG: glycosyltransferase family 9 protein [Candidatus Omnitrophica bacterium]|nr:glycosyltransferase family 9 protein [Candidatus Omnitrophota bacterium]